MSVCAGVVCTGSDSPVPAEEDQVPGPVPSMHAAPARSSDAPVPTTVSSPVRAKRVDSDYLVTNAGYQGVRGDQAGPARELFSLLSQLCQGNNHIC